MSIDGFMAVHTVTIGNRLDGTYVFEDYDDAQAFLSAIQKKNRDAIYDEQIIIDRKTAMQMIADEASEDDDA